LLQQRQQPDRAIRPSRPCTIARVQPTWSTTARLLNRFFGAIVSKPVDFIQRMH
jgi:hypothetical protein